MLTRTQLRQLVKDTLTGSTAAGIKVYDSLLIAPDEDLPMLSVFTPSELAQDDELLISLEINALVMADEGENLGVMADTLCGEIRSALRLFWEDSGEFTASYLGTDFQFDVDAVQPFVLAKLTYEVRVFIGMND